MVMPGLINLDFADVRTVMSEMGKAMMGTGEAEGDKRAIQAAEAAISNPLLDEVSMKGARGVLINITGSMDMTLFEVDEAANRIRAEVDPDANIIVGSTFNQDLEGKVRVSVVATGIDVETHESRPTVRVNTGATAKPWRQPLVVNAPAPTPEPPKNTAAPATSAAPAPAKQPPVEAPAARAQPQATAQPANPVGDVHERIRKMLTEGADADVAAKPPYRSHAASPKPQQQPAAPAARPAAEAKPVANPFRGAQTFGKNSIEAAVDIFKSFGASPRENHRDAPAPRATEATKPSSRLRGDLFDDQEDADLEIPSFLRKKKTG
jgi:cell division protein FtsZ